MVSSLDKTGIESYFILRLMYINPYRSDPVYIRDPSVVITLPADVLAPTVLGHQQA